MQLDQRMAREQSWRAKKDLEARLRERELAAAAYTKV